LEAFKAQTPDEILDLRKQIADLKGMVAGLETKLDTIEKKQAAATLTAPLSNEPLAPAPEAQAISGLAQRETNSRDAETAARIDNVPLDPSRKGYIDIPGTRSSFKIGGYAKLDAIVDPKEAGSPDQFVTSSIPVGVPAGANNANFNLQARLNVDFRRSEALGNQQE
jgi:hypothetical protein